MLWGRQSWGLLRPNVSCQLLAHLHANCLLQFFEHDPNSLWYSRKFRQRPKNKKYKNYRLNLLTSWFKAFQTDCDFKHFCHCSLLDWLRFVLSLRKSTDGSNFVGQKMADWNECLLAITDNKVVGSRSAVQWNIRTLTAFSESSFKTKLNQSMQHWSNVISW